MRSILGLTLAGLYALAFVTAYWVYAQAGGGFLSDLWLNLAALPYTLTIRAIAGSSDFSADSFAQVLAATAFCCALAYIAGALVATLIGGVWRRVTRRGRAA